MTSPRRRQLRRAGRACLLAAAIWPLWSPAAGAQEGSPLSAARFEIGGGARWLGAIDAGSVDAIETGNGTPPVTLFKARSSLKGGVGVEARAGVKLTGPLRIEAAFAYHEAELAVETSADREDAALVKATAALQHYQFEGGVLFQPERWRWRHTRWFASGGGGYLRQLYEGRTLAETGWLAYAGGGLLQPLTERPPRLAMIGLRAEGRLVLLARGAAFDERAHPAPAVSASLFVRF